MNNDEKMIAQELDVSFIGSGGNIINEKYIEYQEKNNVQKPMLYFGPEQETWVWAEPKEGHQYIMGVDVARGDGADASTIVIIDFTTMEQVMEYQAKIQPDLLAHVVFEWGNRYKAYTVVDITGGMGVSTVLKLLELNYKHLHYDTTVGKILSPKQRNMQIMNNSEKIPGFQANGVRTSMVANLEYRIRENHVKIRSSRMISEMKTFIYDKNGRPDHMAGYHDDLLMSLGMALWVLDNSFKNLERLEAQTKAILNSWMSTGTQHTLNSVDASGKEVRKPVHAKPFVNPRDPKGEHMWLFAGMAGNKR